MTESTPPEVASAASVPDALPLDRDMLLGVFHRGEGPVAMIRTAEGEILTLSRGDRLGRATVADFGEDSITLQEAGEEVAMAMPSDDPLARPIPRPHLRGEG